MPEPLGGSFGGQVVIDPVKLADFMRSPDGPVIRYLLIQGQAVKREAQRLVGVYKPPDAYSAAHRKRQPGTLRDRIVVRVVASGSSDVGVEVQVGSEDPIALWHHEGTVPHPIRPRTKPRLVFFWPKAPGGPRVVAFGRVNHPGTKPNRFLTNALAVLGTGTTA